MSRDCPLTPTELHIARLLARGFTQQQIAHEFGRAQPTIRSHVSNALARVGVSNAAQLVALMYDTGWIDPEPREDWSSPSVTPAQRLYLNAFDRFLRTGSRQDRAEMTHLLGTIHYEAGKPQPPRRAPTRDPLDRLANAIMRANEREQRDDADDQVAA